MSGTDRTADTKGVSLARGPALILGTVLLIAGLYFVYKLHTFPKLSQFPSGNAHVEGTAFLGIFGLNGWSGELTAAAGGVLLFGAAQHLLAKTMSLIVGFVLAVVAIIALINHHSALGLFAANIWTIILWGGSAALLFTNTLAPRAGARSTNDRGPRAQPAQTVSAPPERQSVPARTRQPMRTDRMRTEQAETSTTVPQGKRIGVRPSDGSGEKEESSS